jgi:hypothetical protein
MMFERNPPLCRLFGFPPTQKMKLLKAIEAQVVNNSPDVLWRGLHQMFSTNKDITDFHVWETRSQKFSEERCAGVPLSNDNDLFHFCI